ncbi:hypothetical protein SSX86_030290 [Deinandra increscens subsp. villosa]|uniref:Rx N-terminal domain-containing protein n=1 Tax=Deinandra increscens subsp. villosa TaxID=3103831 RepID=A0AAP0C6P6_9ASTR
MGDVAVGAFVTEVVERLTSEVFKEFDLLWGFKRDILSLKEDFTRIQAVLEDAQQKRIKEKEVDLWLTSLRSVCLKVENVLDEISTEALLQSLYKQRGIKHMVRSFMSFNHNQLMFRVRIAHKVKNIRRKLDAIKSRRSELGLLRSTHVDLSQVDVNVASEMPNRETSSLIHDSLLIIGRNEEMEMVTEKICDKDVGKHENGEIRVYGIWGHKMEKNMVIQLWVVNGFIPPRGQIDLYVLGEEIFNCLVWRSFFQVVPDIDRYKMHDLMHDMAGHVMRHDCLVIDPAHTEVEIPNEVLHLSSSCPDFLCPPHDIGNLTSLRSILMLGEINESRISQILNHMYLRVLYLPKLRTLPKSVCKLKLLRYLNLSGSMIEVLPESIIYLQNLQVLVLCFCRKLHKLPEGLRYMTNLQCLDINRCISLMHLPSGVKNLTSLRMLSKFPVGKENGAKIGELGDVNLLEGELLINGLENVRGLSEAKSANLNYKRNLSVLHLSWSESESKEDSDDEILEGLEPNLCLRKLKISHYMGKIISPSWMLNLSNLVEILFYRCKECELIPLLGRLPNLRVIVLWNMHSLKSFHEDEENMIGDATNMFLCLQELRIYDCLNLVSLPSDLPKLKVLKLINCDNLVSLPDEIQSFKHMEILVINTCRHLNKRYEKETGVDWPKISHIPDIRISDYPRQLQLSS